VRGSLSRSNGIDFFSQANPFSLVAASPQPSVDGARIAVSNRCPGLNTATKAIVPALCAPLFYFVPPSSQADQHDALTAASASLASLRFLSMCTWHCTTNGQCARAAPSIQPPCISGLLSSLSSRIRISQANIHHFTEQTLTHDFSSSASCKENWRTKRGQPSPKLLKSVIAPDNTEARAEVAWLATWHRTLVVASRLRRQIRA